MYNMDIKRGKNNRFKFAWVCRVNFWIIHKKLKTWEGNLVGRDVVRGDFLLCAF